MSQHGTYRKNVVQTHRSISDGTTVEHTSTPVHVRLPGATCMRLVSALAHIEAFDTARKGCCNFT